MIQEEKWEKKKKKMLQKIQNKNIYSIAEPSLHLANLLSLEIINYFKNTIFYINRLIICYSYFTFSTPIYFTNLYQTLYISTILSKRLRIRKWKYKKKKINKFKVLRKIRKLLIHKKKKKYTLVFVNNIHGFLKKVTVNKTLPLVNRIPLTERVLNNSYLEFFYKNNKDGSNINYNYSKFLTLKSYEETGSQDLTIFLRNYNQKPYWKLRISRLIHWNFFYKQKSIREQRYKTFLPTFLRNQNTFTNINVYLLTFFTNMQVSWTRVQSISSFLKKIMIIQASNSIFFLPKAFSRVINWKFFKKKSFRLRKKISRWSYLNYKRWQFPWLQRKKTFPKCIRHLKPILNVLKSLTHYDAITGYLLFFHKLQKYQLSFSESFKVNALTKLHMYRYNSN